MKSTTKGVLIFFTGCAFGAAGMWFGIKKYYETKADLEVNSVKEAYAEHLAEIDDNKSSLDGELTGPKEIDISMTRSHSSIADTLNNKPDLKDYTKFFKASGEKLSGVSEVVRDAKEDASKDGLTAEEIAEMEVDPAELERPEDDEPYSDEEDENETLEFEDHQLNGAKKKAIAEDRGPYTIDAGDYELTCAQYEKMELTYHHYDGELTDEDNDVVNRYQFIGNLLADTGFDENDDDFLYVRNDKLQTDFKIVKQFDMHS